jgi:hypothetical protein
LTDDKRPGDPEASKVGLVDLVINDPDTRIVVPLVRGAGQQAYRLGPAWS